MPDQDKIPFDYLGAKKAGYSDGEIMTFLKDKYAFDFDLVGAKKSGYSDTEIADYITKYEPPVKKKEPFETDPNFLLRNVLNGSNQKLGPSGNISAPTTSQSKEDEVLESSYKPLDPSVASSMTTGFTATDSRVGGDRNFDAAPKLASPKSLGKALVLGAGSGVSGILKSIGIASKDIDLFGEYKGHKAEELATYRAGKWVDEQVKDLVGELTPEEQANYSVRLFNNVGQIGTMVLGGAGSRVLGMSEGLTGAFMGAALQGSSEYENAVNMGANPDQASKVFWANTAIGSAMAIPVVGAFRKLDKYTGGLATGALAKQIASTAEGRLTSDVLQGAIVNAATMAGQTILTNVTAKNTYDATREIFDGLKESMATGGIIGSTLHGMTSYIRERRMAGNLTPEENADLNKAEAFANEKINEVEKADKKVDNIINHATKVKENLVDKGLPEDIQDTYVGHSLVEKLATEKAEKLTDPTLIKEQKEIAKDAAERKEQLLQGKKPDEIVTEKEQKEIDEKEKNAIQLERLKVDNKLDLEKVDAQIEETDGRESEANRIKLKELNEKKKRINEDYKKAVEKLTPKEEVVETEKDANAEKVAPQASDVVGKGDENIEQSALDELNAQLIDNHLMPDEIGEDKHSISELKELADKYDVPFPKTNLFNKLSKQSKAEVKDQIKEKIWDNYYEKVSRLRDEDGATRHIEKKLNQSGEYIVGKPEGGITEEEMQALRTRASHIQEKYPDRNITVTQSGNSVIFRSEQRGKTKEEVPKEKSSQPQSSTPQAKELIPEGSETKKSGVSVIMPSENKPVENVTTIKPKEVKTEVGKPPTEGEPVVEGEGGGNVGVSHSALSDLAERLKLKEPERGEYLSPEWYANRGRQLLAEGANPNEVDNPNNTLHDRISIARAHLENLVKNADAIAKSNPEGVSSKEYQDAWKEVNDYTEKVKGLGTEAHRAMTSLQGERDIDTDSFTAVKKNLEEDLGKPPSKEQEKKIKDLTDQNQQLKKKADDAEAKLIEETEKAFKEGVKKGQKGESEKTFKKAADTFRKLKTKPFKFKDENGNEYEVTKMGVGWNDLVELGARAIEKTGEIIDGVKAIIDKIKDKDWYKALSDKDKKKLEEQLAAHYEGSIKDSPEVKKIKALEKERDDLLEGKAKQKSEKPDYKFTDEEKQKVKNLEDEIADLKDKMGLSKSKSEKPLTEEEQKAADEKELNGLQEKFVDKQGNKFSIEEAKLIWDYAKKNYLDKGIGYRDMLTQVSDDLGLSWKQVSEALTSPKMKPISDAMWKKQADYRKAQAGTKNWVEAQGKSLPMKALRKVSAAFRGVSVFGHGGIFIGTHAGMTLFNPSQWNVVVPAFIRGWKFAYGNKANYERRIEQLRNSPNYVLAQRAGLKNNPDIINAEEFQKSQKFFEKVGGEAGVKGFNAIKVLRQDLFDYHYKRLSEVEKSDPEAVEQIAKLVNNATGATNLKLPEWVNEATFAGGMEAARWGKLTRNPARATAIAIKALVTPEKATTAERVFAKVYARRVGEQLATFTAMIVANAAIQNTLFPNNPTNYTNPNKPDFLKFKFGNITIDPTSGMRSTFMFIYGLGKVPFMDKKQLRGDTRTQAVGKNIATYGRGKFAPFYSTVADFFSQSDYNKNPLPFSNDKPTPGHHKLTWGEYAWQKAPLPMAHAAQDMYHSALDNGADKITLDHVIDGVIAGGISGGTGFRVGEYNAEEAKHSPFTDEDLKDPTFKYFSTDWDMELPNTSLSSEKIKGEKNKQGEQKSISDYPKETQEQYINTHKDFLKEELKDIKDWGRVYVNSDGKVSLAPPDEVEYEKKSLNKLSTDEKSQVLRLAQSSATEKTKNKLFYHKEIKTEAQEEAMKAKDQERINYEIRKATKKQ